MSMSGLVRAQPWARVRMPISSCSTEIEIWTQHVKGPIAFAEQNPDEIVQDFDEQVERTTLSGAVLAI
jgi:hypothetical protein